MKKRLSPPQQRKNFTWTVGLLLSIPCFQTLLPLWCFLYNKRWLTQIPLAVSVGNWRVGCLFLWDLWLGTVFTAVRPWLKLLEINAVLKPQMFQIHWKPCTWEHNSGKPLLASFLGVFQLQTDYPVQALWIHSISMIGLIPRNNFEQLSNLIPLGKHLHIVTGFFNWVPNEWQVYEIGPKKLGYTVMSVIICQLFADKKHGYKF